MKILLLSILLMLFTSRLKAEKINNIVVFGDSYSDVGNKQRLSNGPLWSEDLAVGWNASLHSFAFSGAVCNNKMYPAQKSDFIPSITDQVEMYYKQHLDLSPEETVFVFWVGINDVYRIYETYSEQESIDTELKKVVECIGSNVRNVRRVFSTNKFIVFGVPPIELMPYYRNTEMASSREQAANQLNELLTKEVEKMNKHLQSLELDLVDVHKLLDDIVEKPELFELQNSRDSYWDHCQGQCKDAIDSYVWWDKTHLTGAVHRLIANSILMAGSLAPETYLPSTFTTIKSPVYEAVESTGQIDKLIEQLNQEKLLKDGQSTPKSTIDQGDGENLTDSDNTGSSSNNSSKLIYFGITITIIVGILFLLFVNNNKRRGGTASNQLASLSGLLKNNNNSDRGNFMPLRNLDSEV